MVTQIDLSEVLAGFKEELLEEVRQMLETKKEQPKFLRSKDVREQLQISPSTLRRWEIEGKLKPKRINGHKFYWSSDVSGLLS